MRLLGICPQCQALAEKWKQGARQRPEGRGIAAKPLLTNMLTQQAPQTAATLPPVALQSLQEVVLPPSDPSPQPSAAPNSAQGYGEGQVRAAQHALSAVQVRPSPLESWDAAPSTCNLERRQLRPLKTSRCLRHWLLPTLHLPSRWQVGGCSRER